MEILLALLLGATLVVIVPLLLLKLVLGLLLLPFKLLGLALRGVAALVGLMGKILFLGLGLLAGVLGLLAVVVIVPLLPVLVIAGGIWLLGRSARRESAGDMRLVRG